MYTKYSEAGYSVIPVKGKAAFTPGWSDWSTLAQPEELIAQYERDYPIPQYGIGIVCGAMSNLIGLDIDTDDQAVLDACPRSPVVKKGKKGETRFFQYNSQLDSQRIGDLKCGIDLLGKGRQTVIPPSIHPDTKQAYQWSTPDDLLSIHASDLPTIDLEKLQEVMKLLGVLQIPKGDGQGARPKQEPAGRNERLRNYIYAKLKTNFNDSDAAIAGEAVQYDQDKNSPPYLTDMTETEVKKNKGDAFKLAMVMVKRTRKSIVKKENIDATANRETCGQGASTDQGESDPSSPETSDQAPAEQPEPANVREYWIRAGLEIPQAGRPAANTNNLMRLMQSDTRFSNSLWYDTFHGKIFTTLILNSSHTTSPREFSDTDITGMMRLFQGRLGLTNTGKDAMWAVIDEFARTNQRHEVREWLNGLPEYDMTPRVETFATTYLGAKHSAFNAAVTKNLFVGLVARVFQPGAKSDTLTILEGVQGTFKSTALEALGGKWYGEATEALDSKDFAMSLQGHWLIEIPEVDAMIRGEPENIKRVLSTKEDRFRAPYDKLPKTHPRQCMLTGTTNKDDYLRDETGNRRFFPIVTGNIDLDAIKRDRDQLFAEALAMYKSGLDWHSVPKEAAQEEQKARVFEDARAEAVEYYLKGSDTGNPRIEVTLLDVCTGCFDIEDKDVHLKMQREISRIMIHLGWFKTSLRRGGSSIWGKMGVHRLTPGDYKGR